MKNVKFVIEHLEPVLSRWAWIEYRHASEIVGRENLIITNVKDAREAEKLRELACEVYSQSISELLIPREKLIVLDPKSDIPLQPEDITEDSYIVIGGILGDHPPKGRTRKLLTSKLPGAKTRNIGKRQFSIDGAAYVANMVSQGANLSSIKVRKKLEILVKRDDFYEHVVELPYAYPVDDEGRVVVSKELIRYLKKGIEKDEKEILKTGHAKSIVDQ